MKRPVQSSGMVSGDSFCNRTEEGEERKRSVGNAEALFVDFARFFRL